MPVKYYIHTKPAPPRFRPIGKLGIVDWREDCSSCHNCVKHACVYRLYRDEADALRDDVGYLDYIYQCKGCLNCIQECTKGILSRVVNPEYERLGNEYFTPQIILATWFQAATGAIPVSGAGYGGPFSGAGFDSMWTDMSEIVRPTRDGIHGREYISTSVDIGRNLDHLSFENGQLGVSLPPMIESPMPLIFDIIPEHFQRGPVEAAVVKAAGEMSLFTVLPKRNIEGEDSYAGLNYIIPLLETDETMGREASSTARMVMIPDSEIVAATCASLKKENPDRIVIVRLPALPGAAERAVELAQDGVEVIHLVFDIHGREKVPLTPGQKPRHARDVIRKVHGALLKCGLRDQVTLITSGGIALPEHMAKAIICGADLIAIDLPLLLALECRLCGECKRGEMCPIELEAVDPDYAARRICNLMGAWRNQLLEVLGAMGIREVRRLRGETGRSMFFKDLECATFGRLFGKRKDENGD